MLRKEVITYFSPLMTSLETVWFVLLIFQCYTNLTSSLTVPPEYF